MVVTFDCSSEVSVHRIPLLKVRLVLVSGHLAKLVHSGLVRVLQQLVKTGAFLVVLNNAARAGLLSQVEHCEVDEFCQLTDSTSVIEMGQVRH